MSDRAYSASRLSIARKRRGITKTALARRADVSSRSLTDYESGRRGPGPPALARLAEALEFPIGFFYGSDLPEAPIEAASFRALSKLTATKRDQAVASAAFALALSGWIDGRFILPACDVPRIDEADPETAGEAVRFAWGLGERPITNMIHLLEAHGVRVFSLVEECAEVDAFSFWGDGTPFIFLNTMKTAERSRMDAAHELGHLVLHWAHGLAPRGRAAEADAQTFASAFLMPRGSVLASAPKTGLLVDLHQAKQVWKVSAANLAHRMHGVGLLSDWQYRTIFIELSSKGQRRSEQGGIPRETSLVLKKVLDALRREDGQTKSDISNDLAIPLEELNRVVFGLVLTQVSGRGAGTDVQPRSNGAEPILRIVGDD